MKTDKKLIVIPDFMVALKALKDNGEQSITDWHHYTRITYAHIHKLKKLFVANGWVTVKEESIKHILTLTPTGVELVSDIERFFDRLGITKDNLIDFRKRTKHRKKKVEITNDEENKLFDDAVKKLDEKKLLKVRLKEVNEGKVISTDEVKEKLKIRNSYEGIKIIDDK